MEQWTGVWCSCMLMPIVSLWPASTLAGAVAGGQCQAPQQRMAQRHQATAPLASTPLTQSTAPLMVKCKTLELWQRYPEISSEPPRSISTDSMVSTRLKLSGRHWSFHGDNRASRKTPRLPERLGPSWKILRQRNFQTQWHFHLHIDFRDFYGNPKISVDTLRLPEKLGIQEKYWSFQKTLDLPEILGIPEDTGVSIDFKVFTKIPLSGTYQPHPAISSTTGFQRSPQALSSPAALPLTEITNSPPVTCHLSHFPEVAMTTELPKHPRAAKRINNEWGQQLSTPPPGKWGRWEMVAKTSVYSNHRENETFTAEVHQLTVVYS